MQDFSCPTIRCPVIYWAIQHTLSSLPTEPITRPPDSEIAMRSAQIILPFKSAVQQPLDVYIRITSRIEYVVIPVIHTPTKSFFELPRQIKVIIGHMQNYFIFS